MINNTSLRYTPRWMEPTLPVGSNASSLVAAISTNYEHLINFDIFPFLFGRKDVVDYKVSFQYPSVPVTVEINSEEILKKSGPADSLWNIYPTYVYNSGILTIYFPNRIASTLSVTTSYTLPVDHIDFTTVYVKLGSGAWQGIDPDNLPVLVPGTYDIVYQSSDPITIEVDGVTIEAELQPIYNHPFYSFGHIYYNPSKSIHRIASGSQADLLLKDPASKISAKLFSTQTQWWYGDEDKTIADKIVDSSLTYFISREYVLDNPGLEFEIPNTPFSTAVFFNNEPVPFTQTDNVITVESEYPSLTVKYLYRNRIPSSSLTMGIDGVISYYYPLFSLEPIYITKKSVLDFSFVWGGNHTTGYVDNLY